MKRTPIRRVSKKRAKQLAIYSVKRKKYLLAHPFCQIYMKRFKIDEQEVLQNNGVYKEVTAEGMVHWKRVPFAEDIHHVAGRIGDKLNDDFQWLSASRMMHLWVHNAASEARAIGVLE